MRRCCRSRFYAYRKKGRPLRGGGVTNLLKALGFPMDRLPGYLVLFCRLDCDRRYCRCKSSDPHPRLETLSENGILWHVGNEDKHDMYSSAVARRWSLIDHVGKLRWKTGARARNRCQLSCFKPSGQSLGKRVHLISRRTHDNVPCTIARRYLIRKRVRQLLGLA